jgi:hypothetical protein
MSLPSSLLSAVAAHRCFTGCYRSDPTARICIDPALPLAPALQAVCSDCMSFRVGALSSALPVGLSSHSLADELSAHVRGVRGYVWTTSGYCNGGGGFWISAAYYGSGLFLVDASRNGGQCTDLDVLISAFRSGVVTPEDPRMLSQGLYTSEIVYIDMSQPIAGVSSKLDLLASPQCRSTRTQGYQRCAILEFVPLAHSQRLRQNPYLGAAPVNVASPTTRPSVRATAPAIPLPASAPNLAASAPNLATSATTAFAHGANVCPKCLAEVKERPLFVGTYVGCLC